MNETKNRRKLRHLLIRKEIQLELVLLNVFLMLASAFLIILVVLAPLYDGFQSPDNVWAQNVSAKLFILVIDRLIIPVAAVLVLGVVYTLIISHRFCGPLANFCQTFQHIAQGDLTRRVSLRRNDFLQYEARQMNEMIDSLSRRLDLLKQQHQDLKVKIERLAAPELQCADTSLLFSELASSMHACDKTLEEVKLL